MAYRIQLVRYGVENIEWSHYGAYRMKVRATAVEGDGLDPNIFIYQKGLISPYNGLSVDDFVAVCGPAQIADIPIGEPVAGRYWPYYRMNYIEQDFTAESLALEVWEIIKREACLLCEAMGRFTQLQPIESLWVCTAPDSGGGDSQSEPGGGGDSQSASESESY